MTPSVIDEYFRYRKTRNIAALLACFTRDASVTDEGITRTGLQAILEWMSGAVSAADSTMTAGDITPGVDGVHMVTTTLTGNFLGGPARLCHRFKLRGNYICDLAIDSFRDRTYA
jgi:hypothetical protein